MRYVPGNVLGLVVTGMFARNFVFDRQGATPTFAWVFLGIAVLAHVAGLRAILKEMNVHWAVTNRRLVRINSGDVRFYATKHFESIEVSGDTVTIRMSRDGRHDDEPRDLTLRALDDPAGAGDAVKALPQVESASSAC